jgi:hypothetical protein
MQHRPLRPSPSVRASISDDGLVLLDLTGGLVFSSNAVGGRIWQLIEQQRTPEEIIRQLMDDYAISADRAASDVTSFAAALLARGLVSEDARS